MSNSYGWALPTWVANLPHDQEETPDHGPDVDVVKAHQEEDQVVYVELDKDTAKQKQKSIDYSCSPRMSFCCQKNCKNGLCKPWRTLNINAFVVFMVRYVVVLRGANP